jgi:hypothetical protein
MITNVSEERTASIYRFKEDVEQEAGRGLLVA